MTKLALRSTLLAGLALACAAPVASADSIVFLDGGNVAVSQPDGSGKVQLTDGGDWHSPTQSDDGTIAAVNGVGEIVLMAKDGRVLRTITTPKGVKSSNASGTQRETTRNAAIAAKITSRAEPSSGFTVPVSQT